MKTLIFILILFPLSISIALSQEYSNIDSVILLYPNKFNRPKDLALRINLDFTSELSKTRAIYTWIAMNIAYDVKKYNSIKKSKTSRRKRKKRQWKNEYKFEKRIAQKTLRRKKGICGDYSVLFKHLCDLTRVECQVINGYSKTSPKHIGKKYGEKHGWNAVHLDNKWQLIDVTWSAGSVDFERKVFAPQFDSFYFLTDPDKFFYNHFPKDKSWLLTEQTNKDFASLPLYSKHYISSDIELIQPNEGVILIEKQDKIHFTVKNISKSDDISYKFKRQKYAQKVKSKFDGDCYSFEIGYSNKRSSDYLTIFIEYQPVATYKVKLK